MPNKRKICAESVNSSQNLFIPTLNSWYPIENVINSAYRKVLDFKENAEKILEKEKLETLCLSEFSKAILESRSFNISLHNSCIVLKCYITLEKDKDVKKKRNEQTSPTTPLSALHERCRFDSSSSLASDYFDINSNLLIPQSFSNQNVQISGGAKKVNVEVIMKSNPFRVDENEKTTRMELIRTDSDSNMLRFTYYVKPEYEAKKIRESNTDTFQNEKLTVFTNDFFTVHQNGNGEMDISLNEIVQSEEEQKRTEALGEKLCVLLKDRPRHRALLTNECKLNHNYGIIDGSSKRTDENNNQIQQQEDETSYTRELIRIYGQPIVPSFHKYFNYQLSNTHYGYRTLRRLLNCEILKSFVKITKEEIKSLDRVVEFVQLTSDKCLSSFQINLATFYDGLRFNNGIVKDWLDVWYVDRLKEKYAQSEQQQQQQSQPIQQQQQQSQWSNTTETQQPFKSCFLQTSSCSTEITECDQSNHLWFCLQDYDCTRLDEFLFKLKDYVSIVNNRSELILVHTVHPAIKYREILSESRRILNKILNRTSNKNTSIDDLLTNQSAISRQQIELLLNKYISFDINGKVVGYTALFEILLILRNELIKENSDQIKYSNFVCTLERSNQDKLHLAISQLKCVPCLNKFTTNLSLNIPTQQTTPVSSYQFLKTSTSNPSILLQQQQQQQLKNTVTNANMSRLLKQMSLIVITELQQLAIDVVETKDIDKPIKYIIIKDEFKLKPQQQQQQQVACIIQKSASSYTTRSLVTSSVSSTQLKTTNSNCDIRSTSTPQQQTTTPYRTLAQTQSCQQLSSLEQQQQQSQQQQQTHIFNPSVHLLRQQIYNPYANFNSIADKLPHLLQSTLTTTQSAYSLPLSNDRH